MSHLLTWNDDGIIAFKVELVTLFYCTVWTVRTGGGVLCWAYFASCWKNLNDTLVVINIAWSHFTCQHVKLFAIEKRTVKKHKNIWHWSKYLVCFSIKPVGMAGLL